MAEKIKKFAKNWNFQILKKVDATERTRFLSQGQMILKVYVKVKGHPMRHTFLF